MEQPKEQPQAEEETPKLNSLNWLNLVSYILNFLITYGVGTLEVIGNGDIGEISDKYQTIVSPKSTAFSIWGLIFVAQAIFAIMQMFPRFRSTPMLQQGVRYWYISACIFQVGWTLVFAYELIWVALIFIILIWLSLVGLVYTQYYTESENTIAEFWILRFPFAIHCGWLTAASVLNINLVVVDVEAIAEYQLAVGIVSLAYLHAVAVWVLFGFKKPNYTIACVLSWANGWIYAELQNPKDLIVDTFNPVLIAGVSYAAAAVSFIILGQIVVRVAIHMYSWKSNDDMSSADGSTSTDVDAQNDHKAVSQEDSIEAKV